MLKVKARIDRNRFRNQALNNQVSVSSMFESDEDLLKMRKPYTQEFFTLFDKGMNCYLNGEWEEARQHFEMVEVLKEVGADYPSKCLLEYMKDFNFVAPDSWDGYRVLTEK
mmetsp:Transcript_32833/g.32060  ORF Transcript_32833/g.32060 Transcript_32833/m.32060 type:complete len:111 (-) Transcript_32833:39-371(-)